MDSHLNSPVKEVDIAVFGAHPDDAEMGMGGTLIKLSRSYTISTISLTRGETGTYGSIKDREEEFISACNFYGSLPIMLDMGDTRVINNHENRRVIADLIRRLKPKIVFCPYHTNPLGHLRGLSHVDHMECGALVRDGCKLARLKGYKIGGEIHEIKKLYFYMLPPNVMPTIGVDVSPVIGDFKRLLNIYSSQKQITFGRKSIVEHLIKVREVQGIWLEVDYAELFSTDQVLNFREDQFFKV